MKSLLLILFVFVSCVNGLLPKGVVSLDKTGAFDEVAFDKWIGKKLSGYQGFAIGEHVHDSENLIKVQLEIFKYLVTRHNVRLLLFETATNRSEPYSLYLKACTKNKNTSLTDEVLNSFYDPTLTMKQWMKWSCDFNYNNPHDPLYFYGMDIWDRTWELQEHLELIESDYQIGLKTALEETRKYCIGSDINEWQPYFDFINNTGTSIPDTMLIPCQSALSDIKTILDQSSQLPMPILTKALWAYENLRGRFYYLSFALDRQKFPHAWNERDLSQAQNVFHFSKQWNHQKKFLWIAHISHVSKAGTKAAWWHLAEGDIHSAGQLLKEKFQLDIFTIGMTGYEAHSNQGSYLLPTDSRSLDLKLHQFGIPFLGLEVNSGLITEAHRWYLHNENSKVNPQGVWMRPAEHYDALIYIDSSPKGDIVTKRVNPYFP